MRPAGLYRLGRRELRMTGVMLLSQRPEAGEAGGHCGRGGHCGYGGH